MGPLDRSEVAQAFEAAEMWAKFEEIIDAVHMGEGHYVFSTPQASLLFDTAAINRLS